MNRFIQLLSLAVLALLLWFFPLIHIVRLDELNAAKQGAEFDAADFVEDFWTGRLVPSLDEAANANDVLKALRENPQHAIEQFGHKVGLSRTCYFLLQGSGRIVSVDSKGIVVELDGSEADVILHSGLVFGNTARDSTGLLDAGDFPHSQDYNEISTELNRIIEQRVIRSLKEQSEVGATIEFVGCAEVTDIARDSRPLKVIPFRVHVE